MPYNFQRLLNTTPPDSLYLATNKINGNFDDIRLKTVLLDAVIRAINSSPEQLQIAFSRVAGLPPDPVSSAVPAFSGPIALGMNQPYIDLIGTELNAIQARLQESGGLLLWQRVVGNAPVVLMALALATGTFDYQGNSIVNTKNKIAHRTLYLGDETEKTNKLATGVVDNNTAVKDGRLTRSSVHGYNFSTIHVIAEIRSTDATATTTLVMNVGGTAYTVGATNSTGYTLVQNSFDITANPAITDPSTNQMMFYLQTSNINFQSWIRVWEVYVE